jgi:peroxiredoxin
MKGKFHFFYLFAFVIAVLFVSCTPNDSEDQVDSTQMIQDENGDSGDVNQGETEVVNTDIAPDFTLTELDGKQIKFSDYEGKVLVMFFFGNSCPSCKTVATQIQSKLANKFESNEAFAIVGLDQWNGNASSVRNFKSVTGVQFPLLLGASSTASAYKTTYDRLLVVDKKGAIQFRGKRNATNDLDDVVTITATYLEKQ